MTTYMLSIAPSHAHLERGERGERERRERERREREREIESLMLF
jgi:hypothetical protein